MEGPGGLLFSHWGGESSITCQWHKFLTLMQAELWWLANYPLQQALDWMPLDYSPFWLCFKKIITHHIFRKKIQQYVFTAKALLAMGKALKIG